MDTELFQNRYRITSARLSGWDYSMSAYYFITICTKNRIPWFGKIENGKMILNDIGKIVHQEIVKSAKIRGNVRIDSFVVMPDHIHLIIFITDATRTTCAMRTTRTTRRDALHASNNNPWVTCNVPLQNKFWPQINNLSSIIRWLKWSITSKIQSKYDKIFAWQSRYHDHIIRDEKELYFVDQYIQNNPLNREKDKNKDMFSEFNI